MEGKKPLGNIASISLSSTRKWLVICVLLVLFAILFSSFASASLVFNSRTGTVDFNTASTVKVRIAADGNVGINTTSVNSKLRVSNGTVIFDGSTGGTAFSGEGSRFMWVPVKSAIRSGYVSNDKWDSDNIGFYSAALGLDTVATGFGTVAFGYSENVGGIADINSTGTGSIAAGYSYALTAPASIISSGSGSLAAGYSASGSNTTKILASNLGSIALGYANDGTITSSGAGSIAMGKGGLLSSGTASVAIGQDLNVTANNSYAFGKGLQNSIANSFMVGYRAGAPALIVNDLNVGIDTNNPRNSLNVVGDLNVLTSLTATPSLFINSTDGNVGIGTSFVNSKLHVVDSNALLSVQTNVAAAGTMAGIRFKVTTDLNNDFYYAGVIAERRSDAFLNLHLATQNGTGVLDYRDARLTITPDGNIGVATTNPRNILNVVGDLNVIPSVGLGYPGLFVSGVDGNTGVRRTAASGFALDVNGDARVSGVLSAGSISGVHIPSDVSIDANVEDILALRVPWADVNVANNITLKSSSDANFWQFLSTNRVYSVDNNSLAFYTNGVQRVTIGADGNVGINTAAPQFKLEITGSANNPSDTNFGGSLGIHQSGSGYYLALDAQGGSNPYGWIQMRFNNSASTNAPISLQPNGGNVGIATSTPSNKLNVVGDLNVIPSVGLGYPGLFVSGVDGNTGVRRTAASGFALDVNGDARVSGVLSVGSLSGVSVPSDSSIDANVEDILALRVPWADVNVANNITLKSSSDANFWQFLSTNRVYSVDNNSLAFFTNGSQRVTVAADGNVGIGTVTPTAALDVVGDANFAKKFFFKNSSQQALFNIDANSLGNASGFGRIVVGGGTEVNQTWGSDNVTGSGTTISNATIKAARLGFAHYFTGELPVNFVVGQSNPTSNSVQFGGGTGLMDQVQIMTFSTGPDMNAGSTDENNTTKIYLTSTRVALGSRFQSPLASVHVSDINGAEATAFRVDGNSLIANATAFVITKDGNAAIALTAPTAGYRLDVNGNARVSGDLNVSGIATLGTLNPNNLTVANNLIVRGDLNAYGGLNTNTLRSLDNNALSIQTQNTARITVTAAGKVGIGTAAPTQALHVAGDVNISGAGGTNLLTIESAQYGFSIISNGEGIMFHNNYGSSWARNIFGFEDAAGTDYYAIGALGSGQTFTYGYIGPAYNNVWLSMYPDGNIGIGKTSPVSKLDVNGTNPIRWNINNSGTSQGLVTIGTPTLGGSIWLHTPSVNSSFDSGLAIDGNFLFPISTINIGARGVGFSGYRGDLAFRTTSSTVDSEKMRITGDGYIGVDTNSPAYQLDVNGQFRVYPATGTATTSLFAGSDGNVGIATTSPKNKLNVIGDLNIATSATAIPSLYVNSSDGNVALAKTAVTSGYRLDINGNARVSGDLNVSGIATLGTLNPNNLTVANNLIVRADLNAYGGLNTNTLRSLDNNTLSLQTLNTTRMLFTADGNILVGAGSNSNKWVFTDTLASDLNFFVRNESTSASAFTNLLLSNNATLPYLQLRTSRSTGVGSIGNPSNFALTFFTNGSDNEKVRIAADGNVGIGSKTPVASLDINGGSTATTPNIPSIMLHGTTNSDTKPAIFMGEGTTAGFTLQADDNANAFIIYSGASGYTGINPAGNFAKFVIERDNNRVGIGTFLNRAWGGDPSSATGMGAILDVNNANTAADTFRLRTNRPANGLAFIVKGDGNAIFQGGVTNTAATVAMNTLAVIGDFNVATSGTATPSLYINATDGNIGIGDGTPENKLRVIGDTFMSRSTPVLTSVLADSAILDNIYEVRVMDKYAFATANGNSGTFSLAAIDISNIGSPKIIGYATDPSPSANSIRGFAISGHYAFVADTGSDSIHAIDISDLNNMAVVSTLTSAANFDDPRFVEAQGKYIYVTAVTGDELAVIDISNPYNMRVVGNVTNSTTLNNAIGLAVRGKYAYVTTGATADSRLTIIDISKPNSPTVVSSIQSVVDFNNPLGVELSGNYAFVASQNNDTIAIVDVNKPTNPVVVGSIIDSTNLDNPRFMKVSGNYLYVDASTSSHRMTILDISNPKSPVVVGSLSNSNLNGAWKFDISGQYVFVPANNVDSVTIIDVGGVNIPSATIGSVESSYLNVTKSLKVAENIYSRALQVGEGGAYIQGPFSVGDANATGTDVNRAFTVDYNGNVGIATTTPRNKLNVVGDLNVTPSNATVPALLTSLDGNVGIGTATISKKLVVQTGNSGDGIYLTDAAGLSRVALQNNASIGGNLLLFNAAGNAQDVQLSSRANSDQYFNNGGNFGIATITPKNKLNVIGDFNVATSVTATSSLFVNSTDGNVGIATARPRNKLNVRGDLNVATPAGTGAPILRADNNSVTAVNQVIIDGNLLSAQDAVWNIGSPALRWNTIFASNGTIQTSDQRLKENIVDSPLGLAFIRDLRPVAYNWKSGDSSQHYGFLAQQVEAASLGNNAPGVVYDANSDRYGLNYSELISPTVQAVKELDIGVRDQNAIIAKQQKDLAGALETIKGQQKTIADQNARIFDLETKVRDHEQRLEKIEKMLGAGRQK